LFLINGKHKSNHLPDLGPKDAWEYQCQREACGHHWTPKSQGKVPQECPACKSRKWKEARA
jgi:hypothetical protein